MRFFSLLLIAGAFSAHAQFPDLSYGVKGGIPVLDLTTSRRDESRPYTVGPFVEARFGNRFAIEFNPLYKREGYTSRASINSLISVTPLGQTLREPRQLVSFISRTRGNSWEFPVLGKYYFGRTFRGVRPFASSGYAFQRTWSETDYSQVLRDPDNGQLSSSRGDFDDRSGWRVGAVFAGGVTFRVNRFAVAPEFRYTRWGDISSPRERNQAEVLLGISF